MRGSTIDYSRPGLPLHSGMIPSSCVIYQEKTGCRGRVAGRGEDEVSVRVHSRSQKALASIGEPSE